jgi:hypothetical protein
MLGIPGVWRDIRVEAGVLHYILRTGTIVRGECLAESVVMPVSWGDLKVARRVR